MPSRRLSLLLAFLILALATLACTTQAVTSPTPVAPVLIETAAPVPPTINTPTAPAPSPVSATATGIPTPTTTAVLTATMKQNTNIRSGPGTDYALLGNLVTGLAVRLTGRNADKSWWQIEFSSGPDGRGWIIAANLDLAAGVNADAVPIASAPPLPTRSPTQATATLVPGMIPVLRADKAELPAGECTTLRWDVENVQAVFLNSGSGDMPVAGHDTLGICPDDTYTYSLRVINKDNSEQRYTYTVKVTGCGSAPIIVRFEASAIEIKVGQKVTLVWIVACAQAVFLKEGDNPREPVTGRDEGEFQPGKTTTYRLIVVAKDGSEIKRDIVVKVVP